MSQASLTIADGSGATVLSEMSNALAALASMFSGAAQPNPITPYMWWLDTQNSLIKQAKYDASGFITKGLLLSDGTIQWLETQGADIASAASINLGGATGDFVRITGTTTITSLGSATQAGVRRIVTFTGALTLTHNATSLALPGGANIITAAGDCAEFVSLGGSNWKCTNYLFYNVLPLLRTGGTLTGAINEAQGTNIASAATTSIGTATGNFVIVTGTTTITSLGAGTAGTRRIVKFASALTLTYNATSFILPGAQNFAVQSGDVFHFVSLGGSNWQCVGYQPAANMSMQNQKITNLAPGTNPTDAANVSQLSPTPAGVSSNLKITNGATANSQIVVTADSIALQDSSGNGYIASGVSLTINTGTTGANGRDAGALAANTWYAVHAIYNGSSVAGLLSTSPTAPTMPSGYTFKARIGWVRTDGSGNLLRTLQLGRVAQYVVTASTNTANMPLMASGSAGNVATPTWVAVATGNFVPLSASKIRGVLGCNTTGYVAMAAPNNSYGAFTSTSNPPPVVASCNSFKVNIPFSFLLETTNIYWASGDSAAYLNCFGWEDNI